jgi:Uncharacterized protein conserved in bacteria
MARRRQTTRDEERLWRRATSDVRTARPEPMAMQELLDGTEQAPKPNLTTPSKGPSKEQHLGPARVTVPSNIHRHDDHQRKFDGMDRNLVRRLTAGKLPVEAVLDLHGLFQHEAQQRLEQFVTTGIARDLRVLLVITGKGRGGDGVLRRQLPIWLKMSAHKSKILAATPASPRHGGGGAFYICLRRRRDL